MTELPDAAEFLDSTPLVPLEIDASDGRVLYVGRQAGQLLGCPLEDWYGAGFWSARVLPDDHTTMADARRNSAEARGRHEVDYRMERFDGRIVWVTELLQHGERDGRSVLRGFLWDVTGRKRREVALWKSEEWLRGLLRQAPDAMVLTDAAGVIVNMNDQAEALFGYSLAEIVGSGIEHLLPAELRPRVRQLRDAFERAPHRKSLVEGQAFQVQRSDGNEIPVEISLSRISGSEGGASILWSVRDITVRRRVEAQRRGGAALAQGRRTMTCAVDDEGRIVGVDAGFARWREASVEELRGRSIAEILDEGLYEELAEAIAAAERGITTSYRCAVSEPEGEPSPTDVLVTPRYDEEGRPSGYMLVIVRA